MGNRKPIPVSEAQGSMFQQHARIAEVEREHIPDAADPTLPYERPREIPTTYGREGSYVNIAQRAGHLATALGNISERNRRFGFDYASNSDEHGGEIWGRYRQNTPQVQSGAENNAKAYDDAIKREFWYSTGLGTMRAKGIISPERVESMGKMFWRGFHDKYGGTDPKGKRLKQKEAYEEIAKTFPKPEKPAAKK